MSQLTASVIRYTAKTGKIPVAVYAHPETVVNDLEGRVILIDTPIKLSWGCEIGEYYPVDKDEAKAIEDWNARRAERLEIEELKSGGSGE